MRKRGEHLRGGLRAIGCQLRPFIAGDRGWDHFEKHDAVRLRNAHSLVVLTPAGCKDIFDLFEAAAVVEHSVLTEIV
ncbi:MAG: hypothetical protein RIS79_1663 [Verrucomicrobiota bacterium]